MAYKEAKAQYAINTEYRRAKHEQKLAALVEKAVDAPPPPPFPGAQFLAFIYGKDVKFNQWGGLNVTIAIPMECLTEGLKLRECFGAPLSIDVQLWSPFVEAAQSDDA